MTILVGYPTDRRAKAVLSLAGMLARSNGEQVVVCTAIPDPWVPGIAREDPAFRSYADDLADAALGLARRDMPADVPAQFAKIPARSIASGLVDAAEQYDVGTIVVGSAMGLVEHVTVSSVADRLLHSSAIPVAVATRGFRAVGGGVKRVTLAFSGVRTAARKWRRPRPSPLDSARSCDWPPSPSGWPRRPAFGRT